MVCDSDNMFECFAHFDHFCMMTIPDFCIITILQYVVVVGLPYHLKIFQGHFVICDF